MNLKQIEKLEESLKAELAADLEAIRRVKRLLKQGGKGIGKNKREASSENGERNQLVNFSGGSELIDVKQFADDRIETRIHSAIQRQTGQFGLADLVKLCPDINRSTISGVLFRQQGKTVKVIVKGQGRRLGVYEKMI